MVFSFSSLMVNATLGMTCKVEEHTSLQSCKWEINRGVSVKELMQYKRKEN